jgi:tRNA A-37 threonylcarbamoyl transferase component Bud32
MAKGKRLAGVLAVGAMGATVAALFVDRRSESQQNVARAGREAAQVAEVVAARAGREMAAEASAASTVPQLRAALASHVDTATLEDLFASEDWWVPYRDRAVAIVVSGRSVVARSTSKVQPDSDLASRAQAGAPISTVKKAGDAVVAVGASVVDGAPDAPVVTLARPLDGALLADWSRAASAPLAVTDGERLLLSSEGWVPLPSLAGHERDAARPTDGALVAAATEMGNGLWLWAERPLPPSPDSRPRWLLLGLATVAALSAVGVMVSASRRRNGGRPGLPAVRPVPTGASTIEVERVSKTVGGTGERPAERPSGPNAATLIPSVPGRMFGRYELIQHIGEGGMSDVYTASMRGAEGFQRILVVKRLKPGLAQNRSAVDQFIDEARLGSLLNHPNIVQVFDFGKVDDGYYMALEYIHGRNIAQIVKRHIDLTGEPLDLATVLYMAHEVLQALGYAHQRTSGDGEPLGIVHRDVSPGNIVISATGDVKLIDFGIVKAESSRQSRTNIGNVKGNPAFMAPEQARGGAVDARSDLFALGLVMYYALTGHIVHSGSSPAETMFRAANGLDPEDLARVHDLPTLAAQVIGKVLALDPRERFQTAEAFTAAIAPELPLGSRTAIAALMHALFGAELRPPGEPDRYRRPVGLA